MISSTKSFSTVLSILLTIEQQAKKNKNKHDFIVKNKLRRFKTSLHLTVRVCTTKGSFSEHVFIKISCCTLKIMISVFFHKHNLPLTLTLCGLSSESFLVFWPSQYKPLTRSLELQCCDWFSGCLGCQLSNQPLL